MKNLLTNLSLLVALGIGAINVKDVEASSGLSQCFKHQVNFKILGKAEMQQADYYLVDIRSIPAEPNTNVIKVDREGNCSTVVEQEEMFLYPLTNFLGKEIAQNLLTSKYLTLKEQLGGTEALNQALLDEIEPASPNIFFEEDIEVLQQLGINLRGITSSIVIIGEEGIPGHPELYFKE